MPLHLEIPRIFIIKTKISFIDSLFNEKTVATCMKTCKYATVLSFPYKINNFPVAHY